MLASFDMLTKLLRGARLHVRSAKISYIAIALPLGSHASQAGHLSTSSDAAASMRIYFARSSAFILHIMTYSYPHAGHD